MAKKFHPIVDNYPTSLIRLSAEVAALDNHIPPTDWNVACNRFQSEGKIALAEDARVILWYVAVRYVRDAFVWSQLPEIKKARKRLDAVGRAAHQLHNALMLAAGDNPDTTLPLLDYYGAGDRLYDLPAILEAVCGAYNATLAEFDTHVEGTTGRSARPGFQAFVQRLATIYHFSGGSSISTAWSPNAVGGEKRWTPFIRFCLSVHRHVAKLAPNATGGPIEDKTFGEATHAAWKRIKTEQTSDDPVVLKIADLLDHS